MALIMAYLVFGILGFYVFRHGKQNGKLSYLLLGLALMVYPYFIEGAALNWVLGSLLMIGVYIFR